MGVVDFLFPKHCLNCKRSGSYICKYCLDELPPLRQICVECTRPAIDGATHIKCLRPWGLDGLVFIWPYGGVVRKAILGLKYKYAKEIAIELGEYTVSYLKKRKVAMPKKAVILPIPLYFLRQNWRGFNQVEDIGKLIAVRMNWDFQPDILVRRRLKKPQTELKKNERKNNVRGVFEINPKTQPLNINHHSFILLDDVYTTGATIKEAAKVLKRNGAKNVWGLTIAR